MTLSVSLRPVFFFYLGCLSWQQHWISQRKNWMLSFMAAQRAQSRAIWQTSISAYSPAEKLLDLSLLLIFTEIFPQCLPII